MYESLRKLSSDTTYHKTSLSKRIGPHMHVAMAPVFCQILVAMATVSKILLLLMAKI